MSNKAKQLVKEFYDSDILNDEAILERFFHPDLELIWNSADGLNILNYDNLGTVLSEARRSFNDLRIEISHVLADGPHVTIRYKYYIRTMENQDEELGIAHFIAIWEVRDDKIYRGYQVSQPVTDKDDTTDGYQAVKV